MLAIIGGSGVGSLFDLPGRRRRIVRTPFGDPSAPLVFADIDGCEAVFLARHGGGHVLPPHRINYRANIHALREVGATAIVALASVGGISADAGPGSIVVPHQILDYTHGRESTFFDGGDRIVQHIDFTEPYSASIRRLLMTAAATVGETFVSGGVYAATQGPRLETAAEIERLRRDGATLVGMTGMPEAALAREAGLPYAHLCFVVNWAAGVGDSVQRIDHEEINRTLARCTERVRRVVLAAAAAFARGNA